eukprot:14389626-Alexandrium_andersonii.AAC.1
MRSAGQPAEGEPVYFPAGPNIRISGETIDDAWVRGAVVDPVTLDAEMQDAVNEWATAEAPRIDERAGTDDDYWQLAEYDSIT